MDVLAIITGLAAALAAAFLPGVTGKLKAVGIIGGLAFAGYGLYVASQSTGTWYFPIYGFALPVIIIVMAVKENADKRRRDALDAQAS